MKRFEYRTARANGRLAGCLAQMGPEQTNETDTTTQKRLLWPVCISVWWCDNVPLSWRECVTSTHTRTPIQWRHCCIGWEWIVEICKCVPMMIHHEQHRSEYNKRALLHHASRWFEIWIDETHRWICTYIHLHIHVCVHAYACVCRERDWEQQTNENKVNN